jgi:hypothetical protein
LCQRDGQGREYAEPAVVWKRCSVSMRDSGLAPVFVSCARTSRSTYAPQGMYVERSLAAQPALIPRAVPFCTGSRAARGTAFANVYVYVGLDLFQLVCTYVWRCVLAAIGPRSVVLLPRSRQRYLVDPASSDTLVSKIKPCKCKYRPFKRLKPRTAHYNGRNLLDRTNQLDNCGNSRANTCTRAPILACRLRGWQVWPGFTAGSG